MEVGAVSLSNMRMDTAVAAVPQSVMTTVAKQSESSGSGGDATVSPARVKMMVAEMQSQIDSMNISLQYTLYGNGGDKIAVRVVNKDTGDVIREIPPKEMQALQEKMSELVGMIFNEKV
jgi:flagellar protein FlaG